MNQNNWGNQNSPNNWGSPLNNGGATASSGAATSVQAKAFLTQVMGWMFGALLLTAAVSWAFSQSATLFSLLYNFNPETQRRSPTILAWIMMFLPLGLGLVMNFAFEKLSFGLLVLLFVAYAGAIGMSLSTIFLRYEDGLITQAFLMTAGIFGIMALAGWLTKADLSKLGVILMIGFGGIVIASIVNIFMQSNTFSLIIDIVCIIVFTGLIAYEIQRVKQIGEQVGTSQPKLAVIQALSIYITFINLFLTILRLLGRRD